MSHPEIVGLGALNVDYIAGATSLSERHAERIAELTARFEWNVEGPTSEEHLHRVIDQLGMASLDTSLGGSAWNTIYALAQMKVGVRLGYVGVLGREETPGVSFGQQMDRLGIDASWVAHLTNRPCGTCLSYIDDTERVMLIHPGANLEVGSHLRRNHEQIAAYLARARIVHVTSFLDDHTPAEVHAILASARAINPRLLVSFDPGHDWAIHPTRPILDILDLCDLLFVNYREFKALGNYLPGDSDDTIAGKLLAKIHRRCRLFVTKRYDLVETFGIDHGQVQVRRFVRPWPSPEMEIEDATGAGDVFAAAVLAAITSQRLHIGRGSSVALMLAVDQAHNEPGSIGPALVPGFEAAQEVPARALRRHRGVTAVCIAHDADPQVPQMRRFLEEHCGLRVHELDASNPDTPFTTELLRSCGFAVCLFRGRNTMADGSVRAAQRVVYNAGLFHGRCGYRRVAVLVEQGCEMFSNLAGLVRLDFPHGRVDRTFIQLERMLRREGLIKDGGK